MNNSRELAVTVIGAAIGGVAGYLFFTERGQRVRRQIEPGLQDVSRELMSFWNTVREAAGAANEGWALLNDTLEGRKPQTPYVGGQTSPF